MKKYITTLLIALTFGVQLNASDITAEGPEVIVTKNATYKAFQDAQEEDVTVTTMLVVINPDSPFYTEYQALANSHDGNGNTAKKVKVFLLEEKNEVVAASEIGFQSMTLAAEEPAYPGQPQFTEAEEMLGLEALMKATGIKNPEEFEKVKLTSEIAEGAAKYIAAHKNQDVAKSLFQKSIEDCTTLIDRHNQGLPIEDEDFGLEETKIRLEAFKKWNKF